MKTSIRLDANTYENMSPEAVKASVCRRVKRAEVEAKPRRRIIAGLLCSSILCATLLGGFAATKMSSNQAVAEPKLETLYVYANGQGPWDLSENDLAIVLSAVMGSARGEDQLVMQAVAQAIRNTSEDEHITVSEVIEQFNYPVWDGEPSDAAKDAVGKITENGRSAVDARIHYWYNPCVQDGVWFESSRQFICQIGNVRFFA